MSENNGNDREAKIDLRPIGLALGHLQIYEDASVMVNPAFISHWAAREDGGLLLYMQGGAIFKMSRAQAERFILRVNQAIEMTRAQIDQRIVAPSRGM